MKTNKTLVAELRDDYNAALSRIAKLRHEQKYFITSNNVEELTELQNFVSVIDGIVARLPYGQQLIAREAILTHSSLIDVAVKVGYSYEWASALKVEATQTIVGIITGEAVIKGTLGNVIREVIRCESQL